VQWQRCIGGSSGEFGYRVQVAADGGYVVGGFTMSTDGDVTGNHGARDYWMAKVDAGGDLVWQHCYGGTDIETAYGLTAMPDGGWVLCGTTQSEDGDAAGCPGQGGNAWAVRTNALGELTWQTCLGGSGNDNGASFSDAVATLDGGLVLAGTTSYMDGIGIGNHGSSDFVVVKLDAAGAMEWSHCYGGSGSEGASAIKPTSDGGYVVTGSAWFNFDGDVTTGQYGGIWVIKIAADGTLDWNRRMGSAYLTGQNDEVRDVAQTPDGGYLVVGSTSGSDGDVSGNHGGHDAWLVKLDAGGAVVQQRCFGGTGEDYAYRLASAGLGRYVLAGYTTASNDGDVSGNHGNADVWVFMVDPDLNLLWQKCLGGTSSELGYGIARTADNGTIITGRAQSNDGDVSGVHGSIDAWVVKLGPDPDTGVPEDQDGQAFFVYPSPTAGLLNVRLSAPPGVNSTLDVLDITGRVVLHRQVQLGTVTLQLSVQSLAEGTYCARLESATEVCTQRFIKH